MIMYKNALCPVSDKKINSAVIRIHASINVLIIGAFLLFPNIYVAMFLFADFLVRVINFPKLSVVGIVAQWIAKRLRLKGNQENAGPKLFAARIGLMFTFLIAASLIGGNVFAAMVLAGVLAFFSLLEGALGICVACLMYPFVHRLLYPSENRLRPVTIRNGKS
jgi:hypothetical protein